MKKTLSCLAGLVLLAQPNLAFAQACKVSGLSDFGALALGAAVAKVPKTFVRTNDCERTQLNPHGECDWTDPKTGMEYSAWDGKIFRKQIVITAENMHPALPFGLKTTDRANDVAKKLKAMKGAPQFDVAADKVASKDCLKT